MDLRTAFNTSLTKDIEMMPGSPWTKNMEVRDSDKVMRKSTMFSLKKSVITPKLRVIAKKLDKFTKASRDLVDELPPTILCLRKMAPFINIWRTNVCSRIHAHSRSNSLDKIISE